MRTPISPPRRSKTKAKQRTSPERGRAAFTLIEITVVVVIVAMMTSMAVVRLDGLLPGTRNESAARKLLSQFDFARTQAIAKAQPYTVVLDFEEQRYAIQVPYDDEGLPCTDPEDRMILPWHYLPEGTLLESVMDAKGASVAEGRYLIPYDPFGAAPGVHIYLRGSTDSEVELELTIRVLALTGIASVFQGRVEPQVLVENDF